MSASARWASTVYFPVSGTFVGTVGGTFGTNISNISNIAVPVPSTRSHHLQKRFKCKKCGTITQSKDMAQFPKFYLALQEQLLCNKCFDGERRRSLIDAQPIDQGNERVDAMLEALEEKKRNDR